MTSNLKVKLFNFKNGLTLDQSDVAKVVEAHLNYCDMYSEMEITSSLQESLNGFTYYPEVKSLMESLNSDIATDTLLYELKDAYRKIDRKNSSNMYKQPLSVLMNVINADSQPMRMEKIVNELAIHDWVPEIKTIMWKLSTNERDRVNYSSNGGKASPLFTVATTVNEGHVVFIKDKWFKITKDAVAITLLENNIEDKEQLMKMRLLEEAVKHADIDDKRIAFRLSENLTLSLSTKNPGKIFLNESEAEKDTTLEDIFTSPIVPLVNRNFFPVLAEAARSIDKFVDFDLVTRVTNVLRPHLECYAFNYGESVYLYNIDQRYGSTLSKYESASALIEDVMKSMDFDLTSFFKNKISKEARLKNALEDAEKSITERLAEIKEGISLLEGVDAELVEMTVITEAKAALFEQQYTLTTELQQVRLAKHDMLGFTDVTRPAGKVTESIELSELTHALATQGVMIDQQQTADNRDTGGTAIMFSTERSTGSVEADATSTNGLYSGHIGMSMHGYENDGNEDIDNPEAYRDFMQLTPQSIAALIDELESGMVQELADQGIQA